MSPRVKICGLTRPEDAALALELGATHIGAVATESSPRFVDASRAREILSESGGKAETVVVFRDVPRPRALDYAAQAGADCVQLYGASDEDVDAFEERGFRVLRVYDLDEASSALPVVEPPPTPTRPALLDVGGGGSGRRFDWSLLGPRAPLATFVAGGVGPDNVRELLAHAPWGIDLASGVERAKGVKDEAKMKALFQEIDSWR